MGTSCADMTDFLHHFLFFFFKNKLGYGACLCLYVPAGYRVIDKTA